MQLTLQLRNTNILKTPKVQKSSPLGAQRLICLYETLYDALEASFCPQTLSAWMV